MIGSDNMRIYLAAPIFSEACRLYNEIVVQTLEMALKINNINNVNIYVPQRNQSINDKTKSATAEDIAKGDFTDNLDHTDIVIGIVDGDTPPIGTTIEIGYFSRMCQEEINRLGNTKKRIFSLYTDSRECSKTVIPAKIEQLNEFAESQFSYINLLLVGALKRYGKMYGDMTTLITELIDYIKENEFE